MFTRNRKESLSEKYHLPYQLVDDLIDVVFCEELTESLEVLKKYIVKQSVFVLKGRSERTAISLVAHISNCFSEQEYQDLKVLGYSYDRSEYQDYETSDLRSMKKALFDASGLLINGGLSGTDSSKSLIKDLKEIESILHERALKNKAKKGLTPMGLSKAFEIIGNYNNSERSIIVEKSGFVTTYTTKVKGSDMNEGDKVALQGLGWKIEGDYICLKDTRF